MSARDLLRRNDQRFLTIAASLEPYEWASPSLCDAWSNHEVLAHLVIGYRTGVTVFTAEMLRRRGSFDGANTALARTLAAARTPAELLHEFAALVRRPRGLGRIFPPQLLLGDHVTHELDILFAIGRAPAIDFDAVVAVLNTQVTVPNPFVPAYRNSRGLRLRATDADWKHGTGGPVVEGSAADLVSVLGNRPRMLTQLHGDGVELLASRVSPRPTRRAG
jgi:uncharacterized protein (TIGR03083 family)